MTPVARTLRFDHDTWRSYQSQASLGWAFVVAMGAYAILAFDRFGVQGVTAPRGTVRLLLTGFYGWLWLAAAAWVIGRFVLGADTPFATVFRLYGYAHLPLVILAVVIQVFSVAFRASGPALLVALFAGVFWMPALLVAATSQAFAIDRRRALAVVAAPYLVWLLVVGRSLYIQVGHLL
jgi:hypothetical protein